MTHQMQLTRLGRTDLAVSVAGLGCGGHSRLGQSYGHSFADSVAVVAAALDMGVNFIDTAAAYRTEEMVGRALAGQRERAIISTKTLIRTRSPGPEETRLLTGSEVAKRLDDSLARLGSDYVDVYNLHGVAESELDYVDAELVPVLQHAQQQGKIRYLGVTERFVSDTNHAMLRRAIETGVWDVVMVGFNLLNPSARTSVLARTRELDIGVQDMFAVRRALSDPDALREALHTAADAGQLERDKLDHTDPLGSIVRRSDAGSLIELAYRFCRHEPGIHVVLTGTGNISHLRDNVAFINRPPLADDIQAALRDAFGAIDCISGN
jgi:aryl-alcohol dehydrogenase-like predicted oxidoreductase